MDEKTLKVPKHLGIIPDGNRRWAKKHNLPTFKGHEAGLNKFEEILEWCRELGIRMVTLYTISLENLSRSKEEVEFLLNLIKKHLQRFAKDEKVHKNKVKLQVIGNLELLPKDVQEAAIQAMKATQHYNNYFLNLAVAYGGRAEIVDAAKRIAKLVEQGKLKIGEVDEKTFSAYLYSELPDVDLIIRTSEQRISGFLPWQSTYAEFIFLPDKFFPELTKEDFVNAIKEFSARERRFGK
jgi:tritrans,polycis-undecaprenyl-diphosphate synthase [geranylgeranyl-diphosphate specific]